MVTVKQSVTRCIVLAGLAVAATPARLHAATRPKEAVAPPAIRRVTLYRDRAVVARSASYSVKKGTNILLFEAFSPNLKEVSLRAQIKGGVEARIGSVATWIDQRPDIQDETVRELDETLRATRRRLAEIGNDERAIAATRRHAAAYLELTRGAISESTLSPAPEIQAWRESLATLHARQGELALAHTRNARESATLAAERADVESQLATLQNPAPRAIRMVEVQIESDAEGDVELAVLYEMSQAGWEAIYEVWEDEQGVVRLRYYAGLQQSTEEDWTDVAVTLSTAEPATGGVRPRLAALRVAATKGVIGKGMNAAATVIDTTGTRAPDIALVETSATMEMEVRHEATSFAIDLPETVTIARDGRLTKVPIAQAELTGETQLWAVPDVRLHVYRRLKTANSLPIPLVPGALAIYHRDAYVGRTRLPFVPVGGTFHVSTGTDPEVVLTTHHRTHNNTDSQTRVDQTRLRQVSVANRKNRDIRIRLAYAIPVSEIEEAKISLNRGAFTVKPSEYDEEKGHLFWDLDIKAGESAGHAYEYRISGPRGILKTASPVPQNYGVPLLH